MLSTHSGLLFQPSSGTLTHTGAYLCSETIASLSLESNGIQVQIRIIMNCPHGGIRATFRHTANSVRVGETKQTTVPSVGSTITSLSLESYGIQVRLFLCVFFLFPLLRVGRFQKLAVSHTGLSVVQV
jgi:hypothetical protein